MAPKTKITKEMILNAAFEIIRRSGHENLNVRTIAEELNCSTQPILYNFKTMDEIRDEVYRMADGYHTQSLMNGAEIAEDPFLSIGMAYIRFGYEEKNLFRFLFQTDRYSGVNLMSLLDDPDLVPLLEAAGRELKCGGDELKEKFLVFVTAVHGYAALLANNGLIYDESQAEKILRTVFDGMKG